MLGEQPYGSVTEIESQDVDFLEEEFPRRGYVDRNLELYEIKKPNEEVQLQKSRATLFLVGVYLLVGVYHYMLVLKIHNCVRANVEASLIVVLRLRGKHSCVLRRMKMSLRIIERHSHLLLQRNRKLQ